MTNADVNLLVCGTVFCNDAKQNIIENGAVAVAGDSIAALGQAAELKETYPAAEVLELDRGLVMPGLINAHTHAPMSLLRGLADDLPLMTWLQEHIFPVEGRLTPELIQLGTTLSALEMIKSGTTSFCDMYLFAKDVAQATAKTGMRAWIGEVLYDFPSPNYGELENGFAYMDELFAQYAADPLISITADAHAIYTCAPSLLTRIKEWADSHKSLLVIHLAETQAEVDGSLKQFGKRPVAHLNDLGLLDDRLVADHGVMLNDEEMALLAQRQVKIAHCPESNMKLASGVAPVPALLAAGVTVGLGTDGAASNNDVDMFGEMDSAAKLQKVYHHDPTLLPAQQVLEMATMGGARLLKAEKEIGSLEVGKKADMIVLDLNQPHLTPLYSIPSHLVYSASGADVVHSVINGQVVMRQRQVTTVDEAKVLSACRQAVRKLVD